MWGRVYTHSLFFYGPRGPLLAFSLANANFSSHTIVTASWSDHLTVVKENHITIRRAARGGNIPGSRTIWKSPFFLDS